MSTEETKKLLDSAPHWRSSCAAHRHRRCFCYAGHDDGDRPAATPWRANCPANRWVAGSYSQIDEALRNASQA